MAHPFISLYRQTLADRQWKFDQAIAAGEYTLLLYPWDALPALYLGLALGLTPRLPTRTARICRYVAFGAIAGHSAYLAGHRRMLSLAGGYIIGLVSAWHVIMSASLLIFNDVGQDFWRLETQPLRTTKDSSAQNGSMPTVATGEWRHQGLDLTRRRIPSVFVETDTHDVASVGNAQRPAMRPYRLVWQGFPYDASWGHVVDWVVDLATTFRGVNWNHRIPTVGPIDGPLSSSPPPGELGRYQPSHNPGRNPSQPTSIPRRTWKSLQASAVRDFVLAYLLLDFLKTVMITDPYFLGLAPLAAPSPWTWLAAANDWISVATRVVRLSLSIVGVAAAMTFIFSLNPLFFAAVLPSVVDVAQLTRSPLLEPWMYPPQWHPFTASVLTSGLSGFWGKFWHQTFRFGISEPSRVAIARLQLDPAGDVARIVQLLTGFGFSGVLHAAGSYTAFSVGPTYPVSGPFLFFMLQGLGVLVQSSAVRWLHRTCPQTTALPAPVRQAANLIVVLLHLYLTGPILADDFARSGIWLFEPVPVSILRGLGFGPRGPDEGWFVWHPKGSRWLGWTTGVRWWNTGVAIY